MPLTPPTRRRAKPDRSRQVRRRAKTLSKAVLRSVDERAERRRAKLDLKARHLGKPAKAKEPKAPKEPGRHRQMRETSTQKIYDLHSRFYDATFGRLVRKRIGKAIVEQVKLEAGQTVLDVGIGTGASLNFYPDDRGRIVGVDLSGGMLDKAMDKIVETGRDNAGLARANALELPFADDSFDTVFVSHVITVVSDPVKLMAECCRVAKAGAKIVMVNHFRSQNRVVGAVERLVCPVCTKLGWRSDLALEELVEKTGMRIDLRYKLTTPDLWETVVVTNFKDAKDRPPVAASAAVREDETAAFNEGDVALA